MTAFQKMFGRNPESDSCCVTDEVAVPGPTGSKLSEREWHKAARLALWMAWISLGWMCIEGAVGLWQGIAVGSVALKGWALGSAVEGMASAVVVWRFSGKRTLSEAAELRAQRLVAITFWLIGPYIAIMSVRDFLIGTKIGVTVIGMIVLGISLFEMPLLGRVKHTLARKLGSVATAGEGTQNYLCAAQAGAVLLGLAITILWPTAWWIDPAIGLAIAGTSVWEGFESWRGNDCC